MNININTFLDALEYLLAVEAPPWSIDCCNCENVWATHSTRATRYFVWKEEDRNGWCQHFQSKLSQQWQKQNKYSPAMMKWWQCVAIHPRTVDWANVTLRLISKRRRLSTSERHLACTMVADNVCKSFRRAATFFNEALRLAIDWHTTTSKRLKRSEQIHRYMN